MIFVNSGEGVTLGWSRCCCSMEMVEFLSLSALQVSWAFLGGIFMLVLAIYWIVKLRQQRRHHWLTLLHMGGNLLGLILFVISVFALEGMLNEQRIYGMQPGLMQCVRFWRWMLMLGVVIFFLAQILGFVHLIRAFLRDQQLEQRKNEILDSEWE